MEVSRVMTVAVLGGVLGILMMIPLRRAFIVKQHGKLIYPEGTACAEVLVAGEKGGATARMVFIGFAIAAVHKLLNSACNLWPENPRQNLYGQGGTGLKGAEISGDLSPELVGVGYLIGPKIGSLLLGGALLSYWVIGPLIATFGERLNTPVPPAEGLIQKMDPGAIQRNYLRYIGAGAVAAGGIISMLRAMPLIIGSITSGMRDLRATRTGGGEAVVRTERDLPISVVLLGSLGLVLVLMLVPSLGLGLSVWGFLGALMILLFGFLFVTVSSRLTGEIGSSSNPISGMTIATLLMTCLIFWALGRTIASDPVVPLTALMVAAVVCIASSNGGTTSQDLKTGFLVGSTPKKQQIAITVGAITSALVIGVTMLALNSAGTVYTNKNLPKTRLEVPADAPVQTVGRPYTEKDSAEYRVAHVTREESDRFAKKGVDVKPGRYLVDAQGQPKYKTDIPIARESERMDTGEEAPKGFSAPQPALFALITGGILGGKLEWGLVIIGVLIAFAVQLAGVSALPFAVGMYLPLGTSTALFAGGILRWLADRFRGRSVSEAEAETSPGVLLASGYIAGGTLTGLIVTLLVFLPEGTYNNIMDSLNLSGIFSQAESGTRVPTPSGMAKLVSLIAFGVLAVILVWIGAKKSPEAENAGSAPGATES
jgi:uncharacterized oligopeptide transporter (OPT) family protein